jgi:uncharacterized repeat protein (TIGR01451 family)
MDCRRPCPRAVVLALGLALPAGAVWAGTPSGLFRPFQNIPTGSFAEVVAIGDLNHDGRQDVAVLTSRFFDPENDRRVHVFRQNAAGGLDAPVKLPLPPLISASALSMDVGDLTGDGRVDIVAAQSLAVVLFVQDSSGNFGPPLELAANNAGWVRVVDWNGDGRLDVVTREGAGAAVRLQAANGSLGAPTPFEVEFGPTMEAGDVTGDGRADIVVAPFALQSNNLLVYAQDASGSLLAPVAYDLGTQERPRGIAIADVNGDARRDLVVTHEDGTGGPGVGILLQTAAGTFGTPPVLVPSSLSPRTAGVRDLDGDSRPDLVVLHDNSENVGLFRQPVAGSFGPETLDQVPYASFYQPQSLAIGDVNGDGAPDVALVDKQQGLTILYRRMPFDVGLSVTTAPSPVPVGQPVTFTHTVTNHGTQSAQAVRLTHTMPAGLAYVSSAPVGVCGGGAVTTCFLPDLAPGASTTVTITAVASAPNLYSSHVSVNTAAPDGFPADDSAVVPVQYVTPCAQLVHDSGFETGVPNPFWLEFSSTFGTPLCSDATCGNGNGTATPYGGQWFAWFGGVFGALEAGVLEQQVPIPFGSAHLRFRLRIGASSGNGADYMAVYVDETPVFSVLESTPGYGLYQFVEVDLTQYSGQVRTLHFESVTYGSGITNFTVDEVSVDFCPLPVLSVGNAVVTEGDSGSTNLVFQVNANQPAQATSIVQYTTGPPLSGPAATTGADFTPVSGSLTFISHSARTVTVPITGDVLDEHDERFSIRLSAPQNAFIGTGTAHGTIVDNDPLPFLAVGDTVVLEGDSGGSLARFPLTLTPASGRAVTVPFTTSDESAQAGIDYVSAPGASSIPVGATTGAIDVPLVGDTLDEVDETFRLQLGSADFANVAAGTARATIDDDDGPTLSVGDATVLEGDAGTVAATFPVTLSGPSVQPVTVGWTALGGTATEGTDFAAVSGTLSFAPGATSLPPVVVPVLGDTADEPNETFQLALADPVDALPGSGAGTGRILDDDGAAITLLPLRHGIVRHHDLAPVGGVAARDLYLLESSPRSSYEVVVDAASGDVGRGQGPALERLAPDLTDVLQDSTAVGVGPSRSLRLENAAATPREDYVGVRSASCDTSCGADDTYRVRAWETTLAGARFNNAGNQTTVLVLHNPTATSVSGHVWLWRGNGLLVGSLPFALVPHQTLVQNTAGVSGAAGVTGSVTVSHDGPYAGLVGKTVALEPTTGFSFDTPLTSRPR